MFILSKILSRPDEDTLSYFNISGEWKKPELITIQRDEIDRTLIDNCDQFLPDESN